MITKCWPGSAYACAPPKCTAPNTKKVKYQALSLGKQHCALNTICEWNGVTIIFPPGSNHSVITLLYLHSGLPFLSKYGAGENADSVT